MISNSNEKINAQSLLTDRQVAILCQAVVNNLPVNTKLIKNTNFWNNTTSCISWWTSWTINESSFTVNEEYN